MADRYASLKQGLVGCWIPSVSGSGLLLPDLSGRGNNAVLLGMDATAWVSSGTGTALSFDGVNDYLEPTCSAIGTADYTISGWYRQSSAANRLDMFCPSNNIATVSTGYNFPFMYVRQTAVAISIDARGAYEATNTGDTNWHNLVAFRRNGVVRMFKDGTEVTLVSSGTNFDQNGYSFAGSTFRCQRLNLAFVPSDIYSTGQLNDLRIYSRALSEPEIRLLASEPGIGFKRISSSAFATRYAYKPAKPRNYSVIRNRDPNYSTLRQGLVAAYCPSISGQGNVLPDLVGGNHGTLTNMTADDWVSSGDGRALDFDGSNDKVELGARDLLRQPLSISAWAYRRSSNANHTIIDGATDSSNSFGAHLRFTTANKIRWYFNNANLSLVDTTTTPSLNTWHHVTGTFDGVTSRIYLNGTLEASATGDAFGTAAGNYRIGCLSTVYGTDVGVMDGLIDDIRLYSRALTEPEIKLLASKRGIGLQPRNTHVTFADLGVQKTYSVVRVKETDYGNLRQGLVGAWCPSLPNGGSGNTLPDVSGYGNHGTLTNMSPDDWVSGQYGRALDFDGVNDYVVMSSPVSLSTLRGIYASAFVFPANTNTQKTIVKIGYTGTTGNQEFDGLTLSAWSDGNIYGAVRNTVIADADYVAAASYSANERIHVALWVGIDATIRLYINGKQTGTTQSALTIADSPMTFTQAPTIGARYDENGTISKYFAGQIDDIRWGFTRADSIFQLLASRPGIGLRQDRDRNTFYQFPSGSRRKRILTGMP